MKKCMIAATLVAALGLVSNVRADERAWAWSPIGIGLAAPAQLPYVTTDIYGLRIGGLLGFNSAVRGLDCGVAELTTGDFVGLQLAAFTWTEGHVDGVQVGAIANVVSSDLLAAQFGAVNVVWGEAAGLQVGVVNYDAASFTGAQIGGVNWVNSPSYGLEIGVANCNQEDYVGWGLGGVNYATKFTGFACGVVNAAYDVTGYQLGLFNACEHLRGVQIGLVNMITTSKLPIMVIANASF